VACGVNEDPQKLTVADTGVASYRIQDEGKSCTNLRL